MRVRDVRLEGGPGSAGGGGGGGQICIRIETAGGDRIPPGSRRRQQRQVYPPHRDNSTPEKRAREERTRGRRTREERHTTRTRGAQRGTGGYPTPPNTPRAEPPRGPLWRNPTPHHNDDAEPAPGNSPSELASTTLPDTGPSRGCHPSPDVVRCRHTLRTGPSDMNRRHAESRLLDTRRRPAPDVRIGVDRRRRLAGRVAAGVDVGLAQPEV